MLWRRARDATLSRAIVERFGVELRVARRAREMARLAGCAYYENEARVQADVAEFFGSERPRRVLWKKLASGAQYVLVEFDDRLLVAVRGTHEWNDWTANAKLLMALATTPFETAHVHTGWLARATDIYDDLLPLGLFVEAKPTKAKAASSSSAAAARPKLKPIVLGGHSMGGAVASLLAVLIADRALWPAPIDVMTFGAPAIGVGGVERLTVLQHSHRFVRRGDVVPREIAVKFLGRHFVQHGYETVIETGRFRRAHVASDIGAHRRAADGGLLQSAAEARALGVEPHSIDGYYREIDAIYAAMKAFEGSFGFFKARL